MDLNTILCVVALPLFFLPCDSWDWDDEARREGRGRGFILADWNHGGRSINIREKLSSNCELRLRFGGWELRLGFGGTKGDWREGKPCGEGWREGLSCHVSWPQNSAVKGFFLFSLMLCFCNYNVMYVYLDSISLFSGPTLIQWQYMKACHIVYWKRVKSLC